MSAKLQCSILNCSSYAGNNNVVYFRFPLENQELLKKWLNQIKRPNWHPVKGDIICNRHFRISDINNPQNKDIASLKPNAVPIVFPRVLTHSMREIVTKKTNVMVGKRLDPRSPGSMILIPLNKNQNPPISATTKPTLNKNQNSGQPTTVGHPLNKNPNISIRRAVNSPINKIYSSTIPPATKSPLNKSQDLQTSVAAKPLLNKNQVLPTPVVTKTQFNKNQNAPVSIVTKPSVYTNQNRQITARPNIQLNKNQNSPSSGAANPSLITNKKLVPAAANFTPIKNEKLTGLSNPPVVSKARNAGMTLIKPDFMPEIVKNVPGRKRKVIDIQKEVVSQIKQEDNGVETLKKVSAKKPILRICVNKQYKQTSNGEMKVDNDEDENEERLVDQIEAETVIFKLDPATREIVILKKSEDVEIDESSPTKRPRLEDSSTKLPEVCNNKKPVQDLQKQLEILKRKQEEEQEEIILLQNQLLSLQRQTQQLNDKSNNHQTNSLLSKTTKEPNIPKIEPNRKISSFVDIKKIMQMRNRMNSANSSENESYYEIEYLDPEFMT